MPSLNEIQLIGHVGSEPELRFTPNGVSVCSFSLATNHSYKKDDNWVEETDWFTIVAWQKTAERCNQYVKKGDLLYLSGRVRLHKWTGQDGQERSKIEVTASKVLFMNNHKKTVQDEESESDTEEVPF